MNPLVRYIVIGVVGFIVAAGLAVLGLLSTLNPTIQALALLAASLLAAGICIFLFVQAWRWSVAAYRDWHTGRSLLLALTGGVMVILGAGALALAAVLAVLFFG